MKKVIKFPLVLGIVALCSGLLLAGTYNLTKKTIENNKIERANGTGGGSEAVTLTLSEEDKAKGITSASKSVVDGKTIYTYQITFADLQGAEETSFVLTLKEDGSIDKITFVSFGDNYAKRYDTDDFKAMVVGVTEIGTDLIVSGATNTGRPMFEAINQAFDNYRRVK